MKRQEAEEIIKEYENAMRFEEFDVKYHVLETGDFSLPKGEGYFWTCISPACHFPIKIIQAGVWCADAIKWYRTEFPDDGSNDIITGEFFEQEKERLLSQLED